MITHRFGDRLVILCFPCNQFGHQENLADGEILASLAHVRPGGGYSPRAHMFSKCEVNGMGAHPVFSYLKSSLPVPSDDADSLMTDPKFIIWSPVRRSDISWNFEKFLIDQKGAPVRRYSRRFETRHIAGDIEALLGGSTSSSSSAAAGK